MRNVDIIPFKLDHLAHMTKDCEDGFGTTVISSDDDKYYNQDTMFSYTGMMGDKVIGCGGVHVFWEGVGEVWATYPITIKQHLRESIYGTKEIMNRLISEHNLKRVQAVTRRTFPGGCKWLSHLGMKLEGVMKSYTPTGDDAYLFAKVT